MRNLTCIICPAGCSLDAEEDKSSENNLSVKGNLCPRGVSYAQEELRSPRRVVTATALIEGGSDFHGSVRRVPVKSSRPCPREKINALLSDIYKLKVPLPVKAGDVIIAGWEGSDIDIIATRSIGETPAG